MHTATRFSWTVALMLSLLITGSLAAFAAGAAGTSALPVTGPIAADDGDDETDEPDVKARVARISFIHGKGKVRHAGEKDWVELRLNMPVVEGDELVTDEDSRIEVQFDKDTHMRLEENSYLKVATLRDEGIAVSINIGTMNVRITEFVKGARFFEVDAPKTTVAVERTGSYRVDAGPDGSKEVLVSIRAGGEARIYSDTAGFTLKNDRNARIAIDGPNAGEWETTASGRPSDDFDAWTLDRDEVIARRMRSASYGQYYDQDIYGADELTDHGAWVNTTDYGWIWKPYPQTTAVYRDWTPYRYGHWGWVPPFGWVWINDEPWGWATYHHGRWVYINGGWGWSPYGYYRPRRSWWFPALVAINISFNNVCWYPLGYHHRYRRKTERWNQPQAQPTPRPFTKDRIPPNAVTAVDQRQFGARTSKKLPEADAIKLLSRDREPTPVLPSYSDVKRMLGSEVVAQQPTLADRTTARKIGAADRKGAEPLDEDLRTKRIYGGREPVKVDPSGGLIVGDGRGTGIGAGNGTGIGAGNGTGIGAGNGTGIGNGATRQTGVFGRDPVRVPPRNNGVPQPTPGIRHTEEEGRDPVPQPTPRIRNTDEEGRDPGDTRRIRGNGSPVPQPTPGIRHTDEQGQDPSTDKRINRSPIRVEPPRQDPPSDTRRSREPIRIEAPPRNDPPRETRQPTPQPPKVERPPEKSAPPPQKQEAPKKTDDPPPLSRKAKPDGVD